MLEEVGGCLTINDSEKDKPAMVERKKGNGQPGGKERWPVDCLSWWCLEDGCAGGTQVLRWPGKTAI